MVRVRMLAFLLVSMSLARAGFASPIPPTLERLEFSVESAVHGDASGDGPFDGDYPFTPFVADTSTTFSGLRDVHVSLLPSQHQFSATFDAMIRSNDPYSTPFINALLLPLTLTDRVFFEAFISSDGSYFEQLSFGRSDDASVVRANGDLVSSSYGVEYVAAAGGQAAGLFDITTLTSALPDLLWGLSDFQNASYFEDYRNQIYPADPDAPRVSSGEAFDGSGGSVLREPQTNRVMEPPAGLLVGTGLVILSGLTRRRARLTPR